MPKSKSLLTGPEPQEIDKLTEAQKNDMRRPGAMTVSSKISSYAEDDDTPAIEQKINTGEINIINSRKKPKFKIDAKFEKEIKARDAKEQQARAEKRKQIEQKERQLVAKRQQEIEQEIQGPQSLDPDRIREEAAEKNYRANLTKLYPDAKPTMSDTEIALLERRKEKGAEIAGRAKLESFVNSSFNNAIIFASVLQIITIPLCGTALFSQAKGAAPNVTIWTISYVLQIISAIAIYMGAETIEHRVLTSDQVSKLRTTTLLPGVYLRFIFILIFSKIPLTGGLVGAVVGAAIGAAFHYSFLNRYGVYVSLKDTLISTIISAVPLYVMSIYGSNGLLSMMGFVVFIFNLFKYVCGDRFAMLMAYRTNR